MEKSANTGAESVRWDLSFLYDGIDDPRIKADTDQVVALSKAFRDRHKGKLSETLGAAITDYIAIDELSNKIGAYLFLRESVDQTDQKVKAAKAEVQKRLSAAVGEYLVFFNLEIIALGDDAIAAQAAKDPVVAKHLPWIAQERRFKSHVLSEEVEGALAKRSPFGTGAWSDFFGEVETDLRFDFRGDKKTLTQMVHIVSNDSDGDARAEAMRLVNEGFKGHFAKYSAQTLNMVAGKKEVEDRERSYGHPMSARNLENMIPDAVVEALHAVLTEYGAPLARRHYRLKAQHLGLPRLRWSDRNAKLPWSDATVVQYADAIATVIEAYESFSPTLANLVRKLTAERRIDAPAATGKESGAYNYSIMLPGGVPATLVFLNYLGSNRDVMTIAHELGHAVHGLIAGEAQGALMMHAPMAYAETASVFGEMTTFNFLKARLERGADAKTRLALVTEKLDDMMNTVVRQIGFSNFERRVHGSKRRLSVEELNGFWLETAQELYGKDGDVFTYENSDHLWAYISHFHRPFYVYSYAFGELLTQSLYAQREKFGDRFEPLYLELLRAGGSKDVVELLRPFGLDPTDKQFWIDGVNVSLGAMVEEAERLSREMTAAAEHE